MRSSLEHTCAACGARITLRGGRAYTPQRCPSCGGTFRARSTIGGYHLGEILARGGLGVIFQAKDQGGADLAVKLIQPPFAAEAVDVEYFVSEVWAMARLNHPNGLRIFATGVENGLAWIAMEWLPLGSLAARLVARGPLREAEMLAVGLQAAGALGAAQEAGHPHHDVGPENIVYADARTVKVTDFAQGALFRISANDLGTMWGRACFVPPERMRGEPEEAHSDIYSLGATLFCALTGTPPLGGEPSPLTALALLEEGEMRVETFAPGIHEKTAQVLNRMLASEPSHRFQNWGEVSAQLSQAILAVARRDPAPAAKTPAPAPRLERATATAGKGHSSALLFWVLGTLGFVATLAVLATLIVRQRSAIQPRVVSVQATPPPAATPLPVATPVPATPPPTPVPKPPFDWSEWKTAPLAKNKAAKASAKTEPGGRLELTGNGLGIRSAGEDAAFHARSVAGRWTLTCRAGERDGSAGLSVRDVADSASLSAWITRQGVVSFAVKKSSRAKLEITSAPASMNWLRLSRGAAGFTVEGSSDGKQWKPLAKLEAVAIPGKAAAGFLVWSGTRERSATAVFERIEFRREP